jgi:hypothetical protein
MTQVASIVSQAAADMEEAFVSATDGLSTGMTAIGKLGESLRALTEELDGGPAARASHDVGRLSTALRALAGRLPLDGKILADLLAENGSMARKFDDLTGELRMMVVVSRSARLEAIGSEEQRNGLDTFSRAIDGEIGGIKQKVDACASEHATLTTLLQRAAGAHLSLEAGFHEQIEELADSLDDAAVAIATRREAGSRCVETAAERGHAVALAAASAFVSLQVGDATRQRLEHVSCALAHAAATEEADPDGEAISDLLRRVGQAQLRDTVSALDQEGDEILRTFARLAQEAASLARAGRSAYGGPSAGTASFLQDLRTRLGAAGDIVSSCDATRSAVALAVSELQGALHVLDDALTSLRGTCADLVTVAMNVGLRAVRLGPRGRGLVVVAGELERLAERISTHAEALLDAFGSVRGIAGRFEEVGGGEAASASLDDEIGAILDGLSSADDRMTAILETVGRTGRDLDATVEGATRALATVVADAAKLVAAADRLGPVAGASSVEGPARSAVVQAADEFMSPLYSTAREREVHAETVRPSALSVMPADRAA